jgi:coenzyme F420 biosynthesis associated uncharacterized protein
MYERWEPRGPAGRLRHHLSTVIDWGLARQIAGVVAGEGTNGAGSPAPLDGLPAAAADSERLVTAYTGLRPPGALPRPESLDRRGWIDANVRSLRPLLEPLGDRLGSELGPLAAPVRAVAGVLVAAEVGALFGYMSRHVLGQYELMLLDSAAPARLLFVAPNLDEAVSSLDADADQLLRWVALHETTHALQFEGVPWLREHLAGLVRELLRTAEVSIDPGKLVRLPSGADVRALVDAVREGDLLSLVTAPEQRALLDRAQATMSVLEGYAEHVMDAVGAAVLPSLPQLRAGLERRRSTRSAASRWLARLLGLDLKLRQYRLGKRFSDEVVAAAGIDALNRVWTGPEALPTLPELEDPATWLERTRVPLVTKS